MRGLEQKVVVIAGGATGIGAATAQRLAEEGASVVIGDVVVEPAEALAAALRDSGANAIAVEYDAVDEASVQRLADTAVQTFGRLDCWHNNAADTGPTGTVTDLQHDATTLPIEVWHRSFSVNALGYLHGVRAAVPRMLEQGGGAFVHTASDGAFLGTANLSAYNSTKAAVLSLSRHVATRWGPEGIRSNVVSPGIVMSRMMQSVTPQRRLDALTRRTPVNRLGEPEDIAAAVAFLLSDDSSFVNGQVLSVNGGMTMR